MLLQQTRAERVGVFIVDFMARHATPDSIRALGIDNLATELRPLGLHNRRAQRIAAFLSALDDRGGLLPRSMSELEAMPNVGPYVAGRDRVKLQCALGQGSGCSVSARTWIGSTFSLARRSRS